MPYSRIRRIGWFAALALCTALYAMLHLKVNAVRSEVVHAERQIVQLERHKMLLETEFATRSSQLQLESWNRIEFGYTAPTADQFVEGERQLAAFGMPRAPGAPAPIMVASRSGEDEPSSSFPRMVSPLTGESLPSGLIQPAAATQHVASADDNYLRIPLAAMAEGAQ